MKSKRVQETTKFNPDRSSRSSRRAPTELRETQGVVPERRQSRVRMSIYLGFGMLGINPPEAEGRKTKGESPGRCRIQQLP